MRKRLLLSTLLCLTATYQELLRQSEQESGRKMEKNEWERQEVNALQQKSPWGLFAEKFRMICCMSGIVPQFVDYVHILAAGPSCSISRKISKSDSSGGEPVICCLTTSLLTTDGISHEGPRFFTLLQSWRASISFALLATQVSDTWLSICQHEHDSQVYASKQRHLELGQWRNISVEEQFENEVDFVAEIYLERWIT